MTDFGRAQASMIKHIAKLEEKTDLLDGKGDLKLDDDGQIPHHAYTMLDSDPRTSTMMSRGRILKMFVDTERVKTDQQVENMQAKLYAEVQTEPYLSENIISSEVCSTIGRIVYIRDFLLCLQTTSEKVVALNDSHRDMLRTLACVAKALSVEVSQVQASANAEHKAALEEEKAKRLEAERLEKKRTQEAQREDKRRKKEEQKRAAALAKAQALEEKRTREAENPEPTNEEDADGQQRKRARRCRLNASEFSETDPMILRDKLDKDHYLTATSTLDDFLSSILENPHSLELLRVTAVMRKVVMSYMNISKDTGNAYMKAISSAAYFLI